MLNAHEKQRLEGWKFQSPEEAGFHEVIAPGKADCAAVSVFRLNLRQGKSYTLKTGVLEMHPVLMSGAARLSHAPFSDQDMKRFDSFYLPAAAETTIEALDDCVFYIAGAKYENIGQPSFRSYDKTLPIGDIHQIHGVGAGRREVMFTLDPSTPASSLICGLTWGEIGAWTSWPPHEHEKDLEEAYCYFDMPAPQFGLHISYLKEGSFDDIVAHTVHSGSMVLAPQGYHPTVASPSTRNAYFWALAAFKPAGRRYDLAVLDANYVSDTSS